MQQEEHLHCRYFRSVGLSVTRSIKRSLARRGQLSLNVEEKDSESFEFNTGVSKNYTSGWLKPYAKTLTVAASRLEQAGYL